MGYAEAGRSIGAGAASWWWAVVCVCVCVLPPCGESGRAEEAKVGLGWDHVLGLLLLFPGSDPGLEHVKLYAFG